MTEKPTTHKTKGSVELGLESIASLAMRMYFSTYHFWAAHHFSKLAGEIEDKYDGRSIFNIEHRAYVINSILSSIAFLGAAINELYQDAYDSYLPYLKNLDQKVISVLSDLWDMTEQNNKSFLYILDKYQITLRVAKKKPL